MYESPDVYIYDGYGSGQSATVKAPNTVAVVTDPALVVAISPNNSVTVTQSVASNLLAEVGGLNSVGSTAVGNPVLIGSVDSNGLAQQISIVLQNGQTKLAVVDQALSNQLDIMILLLTDIRNALLSNISKINSI